VINVTFFDARSDNRGGVNYHALLDSEHGWRFRIRIRSDSYQEQCFAIIELWLGKWVEIWAINPFSMNTPKGLGYTDWSAQDFEADVATLVRVAEQVVILGRW
jgi:hypothetical protein